MRRVKHKKRVTTYEVLGNAKFQLSSYPHVLLKEGSELTIYRSEKDGKLWARLPDEFEDGRFEDLPENHNFNDWKDLCRYPTIKEDWT